MADTPRYAAADIKRLTAKQLILATNIKFPELIKRSNQQCHQLRKEYAIGSRDGFKRDWRQDRAFYNELRLYTACTNGRRISYVRFYGPPTADTPVWVWCSCPMFTYNLEVALTRFNSSSVKLSNGQLPIKRNPRMIPHVCKHLILALKIGLTQKDDLVAQAQEEQAQNKSAAASQLSKLAHKPTKRIPRRQFVSPDRGGGLVDL
jgi:hypothetical protein